MTNNVKGALIGLLCYGLFSVHDVLIKYLCATYTSSQVVFFSVTFSFPLAIILLLRDHTAATLRPKFPLWNIARVVTISISMLSAFYAFSVLPLTQVYVILFTIPLIITILSIPVLGERVRLHRWAAILVGFIGVLIAFRPGTAELNLGHAAAALAAFCSAFSSITVRKIGRQEREVVLLLLPMLGGFTLMGLLMPMNYKPMALVDLGAVGLAALISFAALRCIILAYKFGDAGIVAPMQYSQILWAIAFGAFLFDEELDLWIMTGTGIIILSGLYIVLREVRLNVSENTPVLQSRGRVVAGPNYQLAADEDISSKER